MAFGYGDGIQQWEIAVAKKLVGEFRRRSRRLEREEFDDLLQDCLTHWVEVRARLTPSADDPPIAYMARVLRNKLTDLIREQGATKRGGDLDTVSLDAASVALFAAAVRAHLAQGGSALIATHIDLGLHEADVLDLSPFRAAPPEAGGRRGAFDEAFA